MKTCLKSLTACSLFAASLLFAGCGGGDADSSGGGTVETPTTANAPQNLIGGVLSLNYSDGRSFTLSFNNTGGSGVVRSDGKTTTHWTATGYGTPLLTLELAYGAYTSSSPENLDNVVDSYAITFSSKTKGDFTLRENTTGKAPANPTNGTHTFTTYPPNG